MLNNFSFRHSIFALIIPFPRYRIKYFSLLVIITQKQ